jgi:hypothetical protein
MFQAYFQKFIHFKFNIFSLVLFYQLCFQTIQLLFYLLAFMFIYQELV